MLIHFFFKKNKKAAQIFVLRRSKFETRFQEAWTGVQAKWICWGESAHKCTWLDHFRLWWAIKESGRQGG